MAAGFGGDGKDDLQSSEQRPQRSGRPTSARNAAAPRRPTYVDVIKAGRALVAPGHVRVPVSRIGSNHTSADAKGIPAVVPEVASSEDRKAQGSLDKGTCVAAVAPGHAARRPTYLEILRAGSASAAAASGPSPGHAAPEDAKVESIKLDHEKAKGDVASAKQIPAFVEENTMPAPAEQGEPQEVRFDAPLAFAKKPEICVSDAGASARSTRSAEAASSETTAVSSSEGTSPAGGDASSATSPTASLGHEEGSLEASAGLPELSSSEGASPEGNEILMVAELVSTNSRSRRRRRRAQKHGAKHAGPTADAERGAMEQERESRDRSVVTWGDLSGSDLLVDNPPQCASPSAARTAPLMGNSFPVVLVPVPVCQPMGWVFRTWAGQCGGSVCSTASMASPCAGQPAAATEKTAGVVYGSLTRPRTNAPPQLDEMNAGQGRRIAAPPEFERRLPVAAAEQLTRERLGGEGFAELPSPAAASAGIQGCPVDPSESLRSWLCASGLSPCSPGSPEDLAEQLRAAALVTYEDDGTKFFRQFDIEPEFGIVSCTQNLRTCMVGVWCNKHLELA
eukprot:CAMPEP_0117576220 /NCGR_PEP_ID=MMETSP0784-20121206/62673_1 /TAXON_ID=39447 /ORGANISM="" /LENGTH=565 /DNA_ID=CAMNT_0005375441 /DNA_START=1 /DNA_END=1696 /DNA_ORIENTATION=+